MGWTLKLPSKAPYYVAIILGSWAFGDNDSFPNLKT